MELHKAGRATSPLANLGCADGPEPGTGNAPAPALAVSVFSVDADGFVVFSGTGVAETFDFTSSNGLNGAHVGGTVIVADEGQGTSESFNVDVTWEPVGGTTVTHGHSHFHEDGFISHFQSSGLQRPSNADGTVFGKGVEALMLRNRGQRNHHRRVIAPALSAAPAAEAATAFRCT